jgi:DNA polymerase-3 subunit delta
MASNDDGRELFQRLSKGEKPAPISLIFGEETFLVDEALRAIVKAVLPDGGDDFSNQVFDGSEVPGQTVRQSLETFSLFGGNRVVLVRNIASMPAEQTLAIEDYLARPAPDSYLVLTDRTVDGRKRFFKAVKACKHAESVEFKPLYRNELGPWVERRARTRNRLRGVDLGLSELIVAWTGPSLSAMASALDKLALYAADKGGVVDEAMAHEVLDDTRDRTVFELTAAVAERNLARSLDSLRRMMERGESAVGITTMVSRHFRIVWAVHNALAEGIRGRDLARVAGCPPSFVGDYERDARRFDAQRLAAAVEAIHTADRALKSSPLGDELVMSRLMLDICLG